MWKRIGQGPGGARVVALPINTLRIAACRSISCLDARMIRGREIHGELSTETNENLTRLKNGNSWLQNQEFAGIFQLACILKGIVDFRGLARLKALLVSPESTLSQVDAHSAALGRGYRQPYGQRDRRRDRGRRARLRTVPRATDVTLRNDVEPLVANRWEAYFTNEEPAGE